MEEDTPPGVIGRDANDLIGAEDVAKVWLAFVVMGVSGVAASAQIVVLTPQTIHP